MRDFPLLTISYNNYYWKGFILYVYNTVYTTRKKEKENNTKYYKILQNIHNNNT